MHFAGMPASMASFVSARQECGVSLGGLMTTEQPAARAGPTLRVIMAAGKFHLYLELSTVSPKASRKYIRSDDSTDSDWLLDRENRCVRCLGWNCIAIRATGFLREPQDETCCIEDLPLGFIVCLAILKAQNCRHFPVSESSPEDTEVVWNLQSSTLCMIRSYHFRNRAPRCAPVVDL